MGTHQNPVQRAVVLGVAVIGAGLDGAFNALIGMTVHIHFLLLFGTGIVLPTEEKQFREIL